MTDEPTTAVATYESRMADFNGKWERALPIVRQLVPSHVPVERIFSIAVTSMQRNPQLMKCSPISIIRGIIIGAQLGLDVSGVGGKAYLIPYGDQAQFQVGYRGLIELARRTGQIVGIYARAVYEGDDFAYSDGLVQSLHHVPKMDGDPGKVVGVWAVAVWANGFRQAEVMNRIQIDAVKASSRATDNGPWGKWYAEMAIKTVIKRLMKKLPDSVELQMVADIEDSAEAGLKPITTGHLDALEVEAVPAPPTRTEQVREEVKKRGPGRPPKAKPEETPSVPPEAGTLPAPEPADYDDSYDAD